MTLNSAQIAQLLKPINPRRVNQDPKGFSYVEAYEIRAHLNRLFGFAGWSQDVIEQEVVFEACDPEHRKKNKQGEFYGDPYEAWTVCYRTLLRLTICDENGNHLATYTEGATGSSQNQPSRADAHDNALKTSESQALKRCAANLGDQFGLSLYNKGSKNALVMQTLINEALLKAADQAEVTAAPIDGHIEALAVEDSDPSEPAPEPRTTSQPASPQPTPDAAIQIRDAVLAGPAAEDDPKQWCMGLLRQATQARVLKTLVVDGVGDEVTVKRLIEAKMSEIAA